MNTRRKFLIGLGAGLLLAAAHSASATPDPAAPPTPSDVVQEFLAARSRHDSAGQYALFSAKVRAEVPFTQFATQFAGDKAPLANAAKDGVSPLMVSLGVFLMDARGVSGYRFSVIGPDPGDPRTVLVRALPPGASRANAFTLKIVTTSDPRSGAPRLEMLPSYQKTNPRDFDVMREHARSLASLSNLRQIGLALILYAQAHDDHLPDADGWVDALLPQWKNVQDKGFHAEALFRDPSAPEEQPWNYAFNRALSGARLGDIKDPSATVMVFESTAGVKNAADTGQSLPRPGRHAGGDYFLFADGHAKWLPDGAKPSYAPAGK
jgi:prepilin-type processing-associated H-X9-DG protein